MTLARLEHLGAEDLRAQLEEVEVRLTESRSQTEAIALLRSKGRLMLALGGRPKKTSLGSDLFEGEINASIGFRVRMARAQARMTQQRLAEAVGLTRTQLSRVEGGTRRTTAAELVRLAIELEKPVTFFTRDPTWEVALLRP